MNWINLNDETQLNTINELSTKQAVVIFKHSTTCSISNMSKSRLDRAVPVENVLFYYLDLLNHRSLSNKIAEMYNVKHESPQILLIKNGVCVYNESHNGISMMDIEDAVKSQK